MNTLTIKARSTARKVGIIRLLNRMRKRGSYEERFNAALREVIRPGDVVWDVGANIGLYSELFLQWVGPEGYVVAFEPVPDVARKVRERIPNDPRLNVQILGLGAEPALVELLTGDYSVNSHPIRAGESIREGSWIVPVRIATGDEIVNELGRTPNIIKIDVEGFEENVLLGLTNTLRQPQLHAICMEIHFSELDKRGEPNAPVRIEKLLRANGFRVTWTDASHIRADRPV